MTENEQREQSLFVSWRQPSGSITPIGRLVRRQDAGGDRYLFAYLKNAEQIEAFVPLPGLPRLHDRYESDHLFPVFANRVMPRRRPDYDLFASQIDLRADADPFEVLARSGGRRATDRVEVFAAPVRLPDGQSCVVFFARGIRHIEGAAAAVDRLSAGDRLIVTDDPENLYNHRAVLLRMSDGQRVGWVPDYLVDHVHNLREFNDGDPVVVVEHVNDASVAPHMRLLCRLQAPCPEGYEPFSGPEFQALVALD